MTVNNKFSCIKHEQPLNRINDIEESDLLTEEQKAKMIKKFLNEEAEPNKLFRSVLEGETTFEEYVREYCEDNKGLGLFKRWKLRKVHEKEFVENISALFVTKKYVGVRGLPIYKNLAAEEVWGPKILEPLLWSTFAFFFLMFLFFEGNQIGVIAWLGIISITAFLAMMVFWAADCPFEDRRNMGSRILSQSKELDDIVQKYWALSVQK